MKRSALCSHSCLHVQRTLHGFMPLNTSLMLFNAKRPRSFERGLLRVGDGGFGPPKSKDNRFTVCPLWPLGKSPIYWSWWTDLNPRPADYKSAALPAELHQHFCCFSRVLVYNNTSIRKCQHFFQNFLKNIFSRFHLTYSLTKTVLYKII